MDLYEVSIEIERPLASGDRVYFCEARNGIPAGCLTTKSDLPLLRAGDRLENEDFSLLVQSVSWLSGGPDAASTQIYLLEALNDIPKCELSCALIRRGYSLAWITLSDKGAAGERVDESGPLIGARVAGSLDVGHVQGFIIPDELHELKGLLVDLALVQGFDLILTTGGTGVGPRDITPEATLAVIEKRLPGFERAMTAASLLKTPHGAISRAVAGTLGQAIIVNMPGSPKAVSECLEPLLPVFKHALEKLQGDPSDCASLRN